MTKSLPETSLSSPLEGRVADLKRFHPHFAFSDPDSQGRHLASIDAYVDLINPLQSAPLDRPVRVYTDRGALVSRNHEIGTSELMGCFGVFLSGPNANALFHMTPKSKLGYEIRPEFNYLACSMDQIEPFLSALAPLAKCRMVLLANMISRHSQPEHDRELKAVADAFRTLGIGSIRVEGDLPLIQTTLYYSPERPDEILALGHNTAYDTRGLTYSVRGDLRECWVPLSPHVQTDYGPMMTSDEVERIQRERYEAFLKRMNL